MSRRRDKFLQKIVVPKGLINPAHTTVIEVSESLQRLPVVLARRYDDHRHCNLDNHPDYIRVCPLAKSVIIEDSPPLSMKYDNVQSSPQFNYYSAIPIDEANGRLPINLINPSIESASRCGSASSRTQQDNAYAFEIRRRTTRSCNDNEEDPVSAPGCPASRSQDSNPHYAYY